MLIFIDVGGILIGFLKKIIRVKKLLNERVIILWYIYVFGVDMNFWCLLVINWKSCFIFWFFFMDIMGNFFIRGCGIGDWLVF